MSSSPRSSRPSAPRKANPRAALLRGKDLVDKAAGFWAAFPALKADAARLADAALQELVNREKRS